MFFPPISQLTAAYRKGELRPSQVLHQCLRQIDGFEETLQAWVQVDRQGALEQAERLDAISARSELGGQPAGAQALEIGPLHGIPMGVKDIVDVHGLPTQAGSKLYTEGQQPADAPVVAALRQAGAIILGKTVTCPFACFDPSATINPWNAQHTPGGSSSGSAAAVASGMCLAAVGTQTGGSISRPASFCGVVGWKPCYGLVSTAGVVPVSQHLDHVGFLVGHAADARIIWQALREEARPSLTSPPSLARLGGMFLTDAQPAMHQALTSSLERLAAGGATTSDLSPPSCLAEVRTAHWTIMSVEAAAHHQDRYAAHKSEYPATVARLVEDGLRTSAVEYDTALRLRERFTHEMLDCFPCDADALVTPATLGPAPASRDTTGDPRFNACWSFAGFPTVSLPIAMVDGMPVSMQLIGKPDADGTLLDVACWCQDRLADLPIPPLVDAT